MGFSQSKPVPPVASEKAVQDLTRDVERFSISQEKEMGFDDQGAEYVPSGISVSRARLWEEALVRDPKVSR